MSSVKPSDFPIVLVRNLPFDITSDSLYELLGKYGSIHQVRVPDEKSDQGTPGTCFVIYRNVASAVSAAKGLNGINYQGRYLVASEYRIDRAKLSKEDFILRKEQIDKLKKEYEIE
ncbi:uncharacterized protein PRCAT00004110001 [Priceomyces carsonii]|uniref:uncharacterized protein n=1 Tax=Priceomyces carsonii TaxID=28549 RepID=UPI002ED857A5|nr:unnamed protein product [Priceomyces carsonii]